MAVSARGRPNQAATHALVGRSSELEEITRCLDEAARHGAALLIFGDPGVGKSALLQVATDVFSARGGQVLAAVGLEHEAEIPLSTLSLLLQPLQAHFGELARRFAGA